MEPDHYAEGSDAYLAGWDESKNPYDPRENEAAHLAWNDGWNNAADAENEDGDD